MSVCLCVYPSQAIPCETVEVIIIKLGTVTSSDLLMHYMLIILTLTFIQFQGHTDLNQENNKCLIISETIQVIPIEFPVKIVPLKVYDHCQSDDLDLHSGHKCVLRLDYFLTCNILDNI